MRTVSLKEICDIQIGKTPSRSVPEYWGGELPWVTISDFAAGRIVTTTKERITRIGAVKSGSKRIPRGTLLLSFKLSLGKRAVSGGDLFTNEAIAALHVRDHDVADRDYLYWALGSIDYDRLVDRAAKGKTLNKAKLNILQIPLPPLSEQRRIAGILDSADALRAKRRAALARLETLTQSIFLDMFGDPATNPKRWPTSALEDLFEISRGGSPRPIDDYITESPDGVNWIMIGDAPEGSKYITATKRKIKPEGAKRSRSVKPGDFLLTNSMSFGRPYIMRASGCIHDGWLMLSPRKSNVVPDYCYSLLGSRALYTEFSRRAPGATVKNLNIGLVRSVVVPVPPEAKQREYADRVSAIEGLTVPYQRSLDGLEGLLASLQQRAFRGEV